VSKRVLIVVPTFNEIQNLDVLVKRIEEVRDETGVEILVVDDNSPDGTGRRVAEIAVERSWMHLVRRPQPSGLGSAYREGFAWGLARLYDAVGEMDADLSHDPRSLPALLAAVENGAALAIGSRYVPGAQTVGWPWSRRTLSRAANAYARRLLRLPVRDVTAGFRIYTRQAAQHVIDVGTRCDGYGFQVEAVNIVHRAGLPISEVPITFREREAGDSKMSKRVAIEGAARVLSLAFMRSDHVSPAVAPVSAELGLESRDGID
jgi:dolichol-phosphate mannosyltransferase